MNAAEQKNIFFFVFLVGLFLAQIHNMDNNEKDYKSEIERQDALSYKLLGSLETLAIAVLGVLEYFTKGVSRIMQSHKFIFAMAIFMLFFSFISFLICLGLNKRTTKIPETETISGFLARKKVFYNKVGIISYVCGVGVILVLCFSSL